MPNVQNSINNVVDICAYRLPVTYAAIIDENNNEQLITEQMVREACQEMHEVEVFPFSPVCEEINDGRLFG